MFKKSAIIFAITLFGQTAQATGVFDHPATPENIEKELPPLENVQCKFIQEKTLSQTTLKSGGNFKFDKEKGVYFETLYPIISSAAYTTEQNSKISDIITGIANKKYGYINKNFDLFLLKNGEIWTLALKPKAKTPTAQQLESIVIIGKKHINKININPFAGSKTEIRFECD